MKLAAALAALALACTAAFSQGSAPVKGEVLEAQTVDAYTYLRLKTAAGETWAAVPRTAVDKGAKVEISEPLVMENFQSRALGRSFQRIVFGTLVDGKAQAAPVAKADAAAPAIRVAKASGADARTVAEVIGGKGGLKDKTVLVRGQVVKFSAGILGKNWVHLQDGSGSAAAGTNDILVTTQDTVAVGDVVQVKGLVRTDVDLGSGYVYAVMIADAALRK